MTTAHIGKPISRVDGRAKVTGEAKYAGEYNVPEGLQFGFPVRSDGERWEVVPDLQHDDDAWKRIKTTTEELLQEREMVKELVPAES